MSEYRPGVTSPHTLSQRGLPPPPLSSQPPYLRHTPSLRAPPRPLPPHPTRSSTPTIPRSVPPTWRSSTGLSPPLHPACSLDFSLSRPALLSTSSSSLIILVLPVRVVLLVLRLRFFPLAVHSRGLLLDSSFFAIPPCPPQIFPQCFGNLVHAFLLGLNYARSPPLSTCLVFLSGVLFEPLAQFFLYSQLPLSLSLSTLLLSSYYLFSRFPHFS